MRLVAGRDRAGRRGLRLAVEPALVEWPSAPSSADRATGAPNDGFRRTRREAGQLGFGAAAGSALADAAPVAGKGWPRSSRPGLVDRRGQVEHGRELSRALDRDGRRPRAVASSAAMARRTARAEGGSGRRRTSPEASRVSVAARRKPDPFRRSGTARASLAEASESPWAIRPSRGSRSPLPPPWIPSSSSLPVTLSGRRCLKRRWRRTALRLRGSRPLRAWGDDDSIRGEARAGGDAEGGILAGVENLSGTDILSSVAAALRDHGEGVGAFSGRGGDRMKDAAALAGGGRDGASACAAGRGDGRIAASGTCSFLSAACAGASAFRAGIGLSAPARGRLLRRFPGVAARQPPRGARRPDVR